MLSSVSGPARLFRGAVVLALAGTLSLSVPADAAWAESNESIASYDTAIDVAADGTMRVRETIVYDFGDRQGHGITRDIPVRVHVNGSQDRIYPISAVSATLDGSPTPLAQASDGGDELFRLGDPNTPITGRRTFVLAYTVQGALNGFSDHDELYWNVIGDGWTVPISHATATVTGPADVTQVTCFAGPDGSTADAGCGGWSRTDATASFGPRELPSGHGLTVVVAFPAGTVADTAPVLVARRDAAAAFQVTPLTVGLAILLALLGVVAALLVGWRVGRDRRYLNLLPGLTPGYGESAVERRRPLFAAPPVSVEFGPPEDIRPGQMGAVIHERTEGRQVAATIVDFAVRRHLYITEIPAAGGKSRDWELRKLTDGDPSFLPYEKMLFDALFAADDTVLLSELRRGAIAPAVGEVRREIYRDLVGRGWYHRNPSDTRARAYILAALGIFAAIGITVVLAFTTHLALAGVGLVVAALAMLLVAAGSPARTGRGSAMLARIQGFRLYIATAEAKQLQFQEREQIFSTFLPYAIVFGLVDRWARTFTGISDLYTSQTAPYWYAVAITPGGGSGDFDDSMEGFTRQASMVGSPIGTATSSSGGGSGFSGGSAGDGGGGGGGGSW